MPHRDWIWLTRLDSSPALNCLKKSAGRLRIRIMDAAWTESSSLVFSRSVSMTFTVLSSRVLRLVQIMKMVMPHRSRGLPLSSTWPKRMPFSLGVSMPTRDTAKAPASTSIRSAMERQSRIKRIRDARFSFVRGKGL